eukprot:7364464-Pyramimonas_sp.AAC.1
MLRFLARLAPAPGICSGALRGWPLLQPLARNLQRQGVPYWYKDNKAQGNHGVSAQKFGIIR